MLKKAIMTVLVSLLALAGSLGVYKGTAHASTDVPFTHTFNGPGSSYTIFSGKFGYLGYDTYNNVYDESSGGTYTKGAGSNDGWFPDTYQPASGQGSFYYTNPGGHNGEYWYNIKYVHYNSQGVIDQTAWTYPRVDVNASGGITYRYG